jgi:hypothetical protein
MPLGLEEGMVIIFVLLLPLFAVIASLLSGAIAIVLLLVSFLGIYILITMPKLLLLWLVGWTKPSVLIYMSHGYCATTSHR